MVLVAGVIEVDSDPKLSLNDFLRIRHLAPHSLSVNMFRNLAPVSGVGQGRALTLF